MTFGSFLEHVVPASFFDAAAKNEVLQVVFWSALFAIALTQVKGRPKEAILAFAEGVAEVMFKFVGIIMRYAPIGIGAAMAVTVGHSGIDVRGEPGQAGAHAVRRADRSSCWSRWCRRHCWPGSPSAPSPARSRTRR